MRLNSNGFGVLGRLVAELFLLLVVVFLCTTFGLEGVVLPSLLCFAAARVERPLLGTGSGSFLGGLRLARVTLCTVSELTSSDASAVFSSDSGEIKLIACTSCSLSHSPWTTDWTVSWKESSTGSKNKSDMKCSSRSTALLESLGVCISALSPTKFGLATAFSVRIIFLIPSNFGLSTAAPSPISPGVLSNLATPCNPSLLRE